MHDESTPEPDELDDGDPLTRVNALERQLLLIPEDRVFTKRAVSIAFGILLVPLLLILGLVVGITLDTNLAVDTQVVPLQEQVALQQDRILELEEKLADQGSVIDQQTDAILLLIDTLQAHGITPPKIVIRPPD